MPIVEYDAAIEEALKKITRLLTAEYRLSLRFVALLLLQGDEELRLRVSILEGERWPEIQELIGQTERQYAQPLNYVITMYRQQKANQIAAQCVSEQAKGNRWGEIISFYTMWPVTGVPILLAVLYLGLYQFVGRFGAGVLVDYLENSIFAAYINPVVDQLLELYLPWEAVRALIGGEYGIITLGFRYAIAIVLPVVGTFFIAFSILEDSGYLPRLAMLTDGIFKAIGLNGRAVIPMVLGLGCGTMATMVTRTLETRRERLIAAFLLALAVPCSAQLGLIMALLAVHPAALGIWIAVIGTTFIAAGTLAARLLPGEQPVFYLELPPLRLPKAGNVLTKAYTRMHWYILEVLPLFVAASALIWLGKMTGAFRSLLTLLQPLMGVLGLPPESAKIFVFGFFRRDYGAAGLYDMMQTGGLDTHQKLVAAIILTLFVPCIAQFAVMVKERGWAVAGAIGAFIFPFAFITGYTVHRGLMLLQVILE